MSRLYDDLKGRGRDERRIEDLELFAFSSARKPEKPAVPPPEPVAPAPPPMIEPLTAAEAEPLPVTDLPPEPVRPPVVPPSARTPYPAGQSPLLGVGRSMPRNRRRLPVVLVVVLAVAGVVALGAVISGVIKRARRPKPVAVAAAVAPVVKASPAPKVVAPKPVAKPVAKVPAKPMVKPVVPPAAPAQAAVPAGGLDLRVQGVAVTTEDDESTVYFNSGVFGSTLELSSEGKTVLKRLAERMGPHAAGLLVKVVGCTDNIRVAKKGRFKDNRELGLARADIVVKYLQQDGGLSAAAFATQSYGMQWSPYPNDSPVNRAKNRTVVLRVSMTPAQLSP